MKIAIISSSLNKKSRSLILSAYAQETLKKQSIDCVLIDLKSYDLPFCGEEGSFEQKNVIAIKNELMSCDAILTSGPIYNYGVNAALKNILDLTGEAWQEKPIGFMCMAGGGASYMSILGFANSLMLNFRCLIIPRFVYSLPTSFDESARKITDKAIKKRIEELCDYIVNITTGIKK